MQIRLKMVDVPIEAKLKPLTKKEIRADRRRPKEEPCRRTQFLAVMYVHFLPSMECLLCCLKVVFVFDFTFTPCALTFSLEFQYTDVQLY